MEELSVIKIGGNVIDDPVQLARFLEDFSGIQGPKILVHGGGKLATGMASKLGVSAQLIDGRRITDAPTLDIVTMVYAGLVNKRIVAALQAEKCNAIGLSGADGGAIHARRRPAHPVDFGFVGDLDTGSVSQELIISLLKMGLVPVFCALTHDQSGQLLNTNADTIASALAVSLARQYRTSLVYCFEKAGVLGDLEQPASLIREISSGQVPGLIDQGVIAGGMIPKITNAVQAVEQGVQRVIIGSSAALSDYGIRAFGTTITKS